MIHVIFVRDPTTGEILGAVKSVGPQEAWEFVDERFPDWPDKNDSVVPLFETPVEFLAAQGFFHCDRCQSWQKGQCVCYAR